MPHGSEMNKHGLGHGQSHNLGRGFGVRTSDSRDRSSLAIRPNLIIPRDNEYKTW